MIGSPPCPRTVINALHIFDSLTAHKKICKKKTNMPILKLEIGITAELNNMAKPHSQKEVELEFLMQYTPVWAILAFNHKGKRLLR